MDPPLASFIEPVHELARAKGLAPEVEHERLERGALKSEEIHSFGGTWDHGQIVQHLINRVDKLRLI
jgi:hypothetical protein